MARDPLDRYYTPDDVATRLVEWLCIPPTWDIIEPSVGSGAWVRALRACGHRGRIIGVDVDPDAAGLHDVDEAHVGDWPTIAPTLRRVPLHLGNPPFRPATNHIAASRAMGARSITLLRTTFVELTEDRAPFFARLHPVGEWTIGDRIRFVSPALDGAAKKTDSVCHSLFFWAPPSDLPRKPWRRELVSPERGVRPIATVRWTE